MSCRSTASLCPIGSWLVLRLLLRKGNPISAPWRQRQTLPGRIGRASRICYGKRSGASLARARDCNSSTTFVITSQIKRATAWKVECGRFWFIAREPHAPFPLDIANFLPPMPPGGGGVVARAGGGRPPGAGGGGGAQ